MGPYIFVFIAGRLYQFQVPASNLSSNRSTDPTPSRAGSRSRRRTGYSKAWQDYNGPGPDYPKQRTSSRGVRSGSYSYTPRTSYSDHYTEYSRSRVDNSPSNDEGVWGTRKRHQSVGERTGNFNYLDLATKFVPLKFSSAAGFLLSALSH